MRTYNLICMSFDGDYVTEKKGCESITEAWEHSNNMGSKWWFYPFHFVTTEKTIKDAVNEFTWAIGKRIKIVAKVFKVHSEKPKCQEMDYEEFALTMPEG